MKTVLKPSFYLRIKPNIKYNRLKTQALIYYKKKIYIKLDI